MTDHVWPGHAAAPVTGRLKAALNDTLSAGINVHFHVAELLVGGIWQGFAAPTLERLEDRVGLLQGALTGLQAEITQAMDYARERDAESQQTPNLKRVA